jgi:hypothetical protein
MSVMAMVSLPCGLTVAGIAVADAVVGAGTLVADDPPLDELGTLVAEDPPLDG